MEENTEITIYIDEEFRCYDVYSEGRTPVQTNSFFGREHLILKYRFVPEGRVWTRADRFKFYGEMLSPL